jgi:hypothetical protein
MQEFFENWLVYCLGIAIAVPILLNIGPIVRLVAHA